MYEYTFTRRRISETAVKGSRPLDIVLATQSIFDGAETERMVVVALDTKNQIIGMETVYVGNVSAALVRVGELFRLPVRLNAARMLIVHNHPSGDTLPSMDDRHLTTEVLRAADVLDIPVLDHVIVAEGGRHTSMRDDGYAKFGG